MARLIVWNLQECMRIEPINDITQYEKLVDKYRQKGCLCNDYLQNRAAALIDTGRLYMACGGFNAFLFEQKAKCLRLYYYINSQDETFDFSEQSPIVTEIIYRGEKFFPQNEVEYFEKCGFQKNLIRGIWGISRCPWRCSGTDLSWHRTWQNKRFYRLYSARRKLGRLR